MDKLVINKPPNCFMKRFLCSFITVLLYMGQANSKELSVGWELWYPYQYYNKERQLVGLDIESFNAIMAEANLAYTTAEIPWKTHLHYLKTGKMDMAMGASLSSEREKYAYFTQPYRHETVRLFVKKGLSSSIKLDSLSDLIGSKYILGVESGYYYGELYQELIKTSAFRTNISEVIDLEQNVTLVLQGHLDGFLVDPNTMQSFVEKYQLEDKFEAHPLEIYSADIFIMLSKKTTDKALLQRVDNAITTLRDNGKLKQINARWKTSHNSD
jgi:polar amino acid transport system substrate-binding protein